MAKVSKKSEKITAFGGIFFVLDKFDSGYGDGSALYHFLQKLDHQNRPHDP